MPQSNVIFFYLFAAFGIFITARGELPKYMGFLLASPAPAKSTQKITVTDLPPIATTAAAFLG